MNAHHGVFYKMEPTTSGRGLRLLARTRTRSGRAIPNASRSARASSGSARSRSSSIAARATCPPDYIQIRSSLGEAAPRNVIVVCPILFEGEVKAVIELASFEQLQRIHLAFLDQMTASRSAS